MPQNDIYRIDIQHNDTKRNDYDMEMNDTKKYKGFANAIQHYSTQENENDCEPECH